MLRNEKGGEEGREKERVKKKEASVSYWNLFGKVCHWAWIYASF